MKSLRHQTGVRYSDVEYFGKSAVIRSAFASVPILTLKVASAVRRAISVFCAMFQCDDGK